ncbi:uncharacterized protein [Parasteatoda tepidariorum]|uniref:uncharacterized protein n=1 Tax=Parasteatoda tepidariorum TaxID=114398 RepID=UPI00077F9D76|nr:uncharacterized protein LOC107436972 [Parasteatoda tepidariorum]
MSIIITTMGTGGDVSRFILFSINILLLTNQVSAYYCNHDLCKEDQYCCGDNLCCEYVYSPWYFWAGVVFMILILSACGGLFRYCYDNNSSYVILQTTGDGYYPTKCLDDDKALNNVIINRDAPPAYSVAHTPDNYQRFSYYEQHKSSSS